MCEASQRAGRFKSPGHLIQSWVSTGQTPEWLDTGEKALAGTWESTCNQPTGTRPTFFNRFLNARPLLLRCTIKPIWAVNRKKLFI